MDQDLSKLINSSPDSIQTPPSAAILELQTSSPNDDHHHDREDEELHHKTRRVNGLSLPLSPIQAVTVTYLLLCPTSTSILILQFMPSLLTPAKSISLIFFLSLFYSLTLCCGIKACVTDVGQEAFVSIHEKRQMVDSLYCSICMHEV